MLLQVNRPCELANTLSIPNSSIAAYGTVDLKFGGSTINGFENNFPLILIIFNRINERPNYIARMICRYKYGYGPTFLDTFPAGKVIELDIVGMRDHPFHLHQFVTSYQDKNIFPFHITCRKYTGFITKLFQWRGILPRGWRSSPTFNQEVFFAGMLWNINKSISAFFTTARIDWHDTLYVPANEAIVRFYSDSFTGPILLHWFVFFQPVISVNV